MIYLYFLSYSQLMLLNLLLVLSAVSETLTAALAFLSFHYEKKKLSRFLQEILILFQQLILLFSGAFVLNHASHGFVLPVPMGAVRNTAFLLLLVCTALKGMSDRRLWLAAGVIPAAMTLPLSEQLTGKYYPFLLFLAVSCFLLRSFYEIHRYGRGNRTHFHGFSVKQAMDSMDFGLMLYKGEGSCRGEILICNKKMQQLMLTLTGKIMLSGSDFYENLCFHRNLLSEAGAADNENPLAFHLKDGRIWRFKQQTMESKGKHYMLLTGSDVTEYTMARENLKEQDASLKEKNQELKEMLGSLQSIVIREETLRAKTRVHDYLGQQISLILGAVREHREISPESLKPLGESLTEKLRTAEPDCRQALLLAAESFRSLGVAVSIQGEFPEKGRLQRSFYEIAAEAMTNAVHHGYATEIRIETGLQNGVWFLKAEDNGWGKTGKITEGGGLSGMRRRTEAMGGTFRYTESPHFCIFAEIPEEENL